MRITAFIIGFVFVLYAAIRAWTVAITHDEAYTFLNFVVDPVWNSLNPTAGNANNHVLNTLICKLIYSLFGNHLFLMRLYAVAMLGIYLWYGYRVLSLTGNSIVIISGLVLLGANPFLLDFFSLIRGYAGALACMMAALFYTACYLSDGKSAHLHRSIIPAGLSVLFHLSFLNLFVPFCGMLLLISFFKVRNAGNAGWVSGFIRLVWPVLLTAAIVLAHSLLKARQLGKIGDLLYGGSTGLWDDVLFPLVYFSSFGEQYGLGDWWHLPFLKYAIIGLFFLAGVVLVLRLKDRPRPAGTMFPAFLWILFGLVIINIVLQHFLLGNTYPNGRLVIFFIPLFMLLVSFLFGHAVRTHAAFAVFPVLLAAGAVLHQSKTANLTHAFDWRFDADTDTMLADLERISKEETGPVSLGIDWLIEPGANYYRLSKKYQDWLPPLDRNGMQPNHYYFYCHRGTMPPASKFSVLKKYPVSEYRLLKNLGE